MDKFTQHVESGKFKTSLDSKVAEGPTEACINKGKDSGKLQKLDIDTDAVENERDSPSMYKVSGTVDSVSL